MHVYYPGSGFLFINSIKINSKKKKTEIIIRILWIIINASGNFFFNIEASYSDWVFKNTVSFHRHAEMDIT